MGFCNIGAGRCNLHHQLTCPEIGCLKNNYNGHNKTGHYGVFNPRSWLSGTLAKKYGVSRTTINKLAK